MSMPIFNEKQTSYCKLLGKISLPSLANQQLAKIHVVCTVSKVTNSDRTPRSIKELIGHRNSYYDLRGNKILKLPKGQHYNLGFKIMEIHSTKTMELNT